MSDYETKRKALEKQMRELEAEMAALKMSHEASVKKPEVKKPEENPDDWEKVPDEPYNSRRVRGLFFVPKGKYYVGDLCYEMKDEIYDGIWGSKFGYELGLYRRKSDGAMFGMFSTGGDGCWKNDWGKEYPVDAGILGVASVALCKGENKDNYEDFEYETECWYGEGEDEDNEVFIFGHVCLSAPGWEDEDE